jgi:3-dehydroquinate synthase
VSFKMETLLIQAKSKTYPIYLGEGIIDQVAKLLPDVYSSFFIVTDAVLAPLYLERVEEALHSVAPVYTAIVPSGEGSKSFDVYKNLLDQLLKLNLDRKCCVIALGGGVIGDLAGFVAATYLRGVGFIQMPTTLLAHDSSVGGKVGINHEKGKNLIGAFYNPDAVLYETTFLTSLPDREWRSGFSELIKHSFLDSVAFFEELKSAIPNFEKLKAETVTPFLRRGIGVKAAIVEEDEQEQGKRAYLNFGHTLGHALEKEAGYGTLTHGEGVAIGMCFALQLSEAVFKVTLPNKDLVEWLKALSLPTTIPETLSSHRLIDGMKRDKKRKGEVIRFVLLRSVGDPTLVEIPEDQLFDQLERFRKGEQTSR